MKLLALDLSTKCSGYAFYNDNQLIESGAISQNEKDPIERIAKMSDKILQLIKKIQPDNVIAEEVLPETGRGNLHTMKILTYLQGILAVSLLNELNIKIDFKYPGEWRKLCGIQTGRGIKRDELKKASLAKVKEIFNIDCPTDDEADAILLGYAATKGE